MARFRGRWRDAFEALSPQQQLVVLQRAYEAIARACERLQGSAPTPCGINIASDAASQLLRRYEVYLRKARRYQMRQQEIMEWTLNDLARTLAWKGINEVRD